jgi:O-antigen ligase/polysaccharide polymerase Wzy-like membrane protein
MFRLIQRRVRPGPAMNGALSAGTQPGPESAPGTHRGAAWSRLWLLAAVAAGAVAQGGFFPAGRSVVGALLVVALIAALRWQRPTVAELRLGPVSAAAALAGWAVLEGVVRAAPMSAAQYVLLLAGVVAVLLVCRRLDAGERELLLGGVLAVGLVVAATGWVGVALRLRPWALPDQGLWRAAGTLSYANAAAALLVPLALVALGMLAARPRSIGLALAATGLLAGAGATLSRGGFAGLLVGLFLLVLLVRAGQPLRAVVRAVAGPALGAAVALAGLLPAMPATAAPHPALGIAALVAGMAVTALLTRVRGPALAATLLAIVIVAGLAVGGLNTVGRAPSSVTDAAGQIRAARLSVVSSDRSGATAAALHLLATRPLTGVGPGQATLRWTGQDGVLRVQRYVHNEYLQVTTELGVVGGGLLLWLLGALARLAWRGRTVASSQASSQVVWAGIVAGLGALAVHSAFDFVWHLPLLPLVAAVLIGVLTSPVLRPPVAPPAAEPSGTDQKDQKEESK